MGSTNQVTQNGNTTCGWTTWGGDISNHDVIVLQLDNPGPGGSGVMMSNLVNRGSAYDFAVTVVGSDAVSFRANNSSVG